MNIIRQTNLIRMPFINEQTIEIGKAFSYATLNSISLNVYYGAGITGKPRVKKGPIAIGGLMATYQTTTISAEGINQQGWTSSAYIKATFRGYGLGFGGTHDPSTGEIKPYRGLIVPITKSENDIHKYLGTGGSIKLASDIEFRIGIAVYFGLGGGISLGINFSEFSRRYTSFRSLSLSCD